MKVRREVNPAKATAAPAKAKAGARARAKRPRAPSSNRAPASDFVAAQPASQKRALTPPTTGYDDPAFDRALDEATGSFARDGNKVTPLFDGVHSFPARNAAIAAAKKSILFQTFVFRSDETGWELAKELAAKAQEGIPVLVIYDELGSGNADPKIFQFMRDAGVEVRGYGNAKREPWNINARWHEKHLIIDGEISFEGGMNISNEYALGGSGQLWLSGGVAKEPWRDTDIRVEGPAAVDAARAFLRNWATLGSAVPDDQLHLFLTNPKPREGGVTARVVQHRPGQEGDGHTMALLLKAIDTAKHNITIENAYFVPPPELSQALIAAAKRGVNVQIVTNSATTHDNMPVYFASRYFYDDLLEAGVRIYEKKGGTIHAKTATFDGAFSLIGSANLNGRSKGRDSEVIVAVKDRTLAREMEVRFTTVLPPASEEITLDMLRAESVRTNLKQWAWSTLAWML